ncbi:hypothetical protein J6590_014729 [Homalodisca vitripennis]|nr:hypothetical protein J6590_014729 [Homalodisca vitripennis]
MRTGLRSTCVRGADVCTRARRLCPTTTDTSVGRPLSSTISVYIAVALADYSRCMCTGIDGRCTLILHADGTQAYMCKGCGRLYKGKKAMSDHQRYECGKDPQFHCRFCPYKAKLKGNFRRHLAIRHCNQDTAETMR